MSCNCKGKSANNRTTAVHGLWGGQKPVNPPIPTNNFRQTTTPKQPQQQANAIDHLFNAVTRGR